MTVTNRVRKMIAKKTSWAELKSFERIVAHKILIAEVKNGSVWEEKGGEKA
jgi:hypothetical protein